MSAGTVRSKIEIIRGILPHVRRECLNDREHWDALMAAFDELYEAGTAGAPAQEDEAAREQRLHEWMGEAASAPETGWHRQWLQD